MIQISSLTKNFGHVCAVDDISLEINNGEILGLLGPNGAGKTTTLRILTGYLMPSSGAITVKDHSIYDHALEIKKLIGYLPEAAPLYPDMMVYDYLQFVADIRGLHVDAKASRIRETAGMCGLYDVMHKSIHELSKGYKQRVGLAHAMMSDPEILILDEPTSGLDPNQIVEIRDIIKTIGKHKTVILSTHILSEAEATCDRIVIINKGKIVADGSTEELKQGSGNDSIIHISLECDDFEAVESALTSLADVKAVLLSSRENGVLNVQLSCSTDSDIRRDVYGVIKQKNWPLLAFYRETRTLENIFRELTRET